MKNITCYECRQNDLISTITSIGITTTLAAYPPFLDAEGNMHEHDGNYKTEGFVCSNGHSFSREVLSECWCGWKQRPIVSLMMKIEGPLVLGPDDPTSKPIGFKVSEKIGIAVHNSDAADIIVKK